MRVIMLAAIALILSATCPLWAEDGHGASLPIPRLGRPLEGAAGPASTQGTQHGPNPDFTGLMTRSRALDAGEIMARTSPAIVMIRVTRADGPGQGTGFLVGSGGLIATCNHVVENAAAIEVVTRQGTSSRSVRVVATQPDADLAILAVSGLGPAPFLALGDSSSVVVGEHIVAVGHPLGLEYSLSEGIVSALRDTDHKGVDLIQFTAPVSTGCSGCPLLDASGRAVGIVSLSHSSGQNLNFAVPVNYLRRLLARVDSGQTAFDGLRAGGRDEYATRATASDAPAPQALASKGGLPDTVSLVPDHIDDVTTPRTRVFRSGAHGFSLLCPAAWHVVPDERKRGLMVRLDSPDGKVKMDFATVQLSAATDLESFSVSMLAAIESSQMAAELGNQDLLAAAEAPRLLRTANVTVAGCSWRVYVHLHRDPNGGHVYQVTMLSVKATQAYVVRYSVGAADWERTRPVVQQLIGQVAVF